MDNIPREEKRVPGRAKLLTQPSWSLTGHLGPLSQLRCLDTAEVDVEISSCGPATNVTMSTSGRVWHYSTGERCPKCAVHEKSLYYDPACATSGGMRKINKLARPRTYYYVGKTQNNTRHGWGRLMDDRRLICEGQHDYGVMRGFYLVYHEYSVEIGVTLPWGRIGAYLLADRDSSLAPFAYEPDGSIASSLSDPYVRIQKTRQGVQMELIGESLVAVRSFAPPRKSNSIKLADDSTFAASNGGLSKSLDFNYLCPTRRWRRETSTTRRLVGRSDDETIDSTKLSSSDSLPPPPPSRKSQQHRRQSAGNRNIDNFCGNEAQSVGDADDVNATRSYDETVENLGSSLHCRSLGEHSFGSNRRPSATSESDCAMVADCQSADDMCPDYSTRSASSSQQVLHSSSSCSCVCAANAETNFRQRRNSWPRLGQHGDMRWAYRAFEASPLSPLRKQTWECPERLNFSEHRWRVTAMNALNGKRLRGVSSWAWSSEDLARFLCAIGLPDLAYHFVHQGISGYDLKDITEDRLLHEFCVDCEATLPFILSVFRTLIAANDETDLLYPFHLMAKPRDCQVFGASEFVLRRRLGVGGHAVVYQATRPSETNDSINHVALKCFPHNNRKKRVLITEPVPEETSETPPASGGNKLRTKMAGSFTSFRRWVRGNNNDKMPTIILSKVLSNGGGASWQRSASMDNLLYSRTGGERARDKELMVLQSLPPHPNIIKCLGQVGGNITGIVLEFCDRGAIHDAVMPSNLCGANACHGGGRESMSRRNIVKFFCDIAKGLAFLHDAGFVHRDLKPSNFLISANGTAKLSDFGMASRWRSINQVYLGSYGNIFYAAPEVLLGRGYWPESDIFSLGVSLWEALSRDGAYRSMSKGEIFCAVCTNQYMQSFNLTSIGSTELACLIERMLAFDHRLRPSALEIAQALNELLNRSHQIALSRVQSLFDI